MTTAKPSARYGAMWGRACGRLCSTDLHHLQGHDRQFSRENGSSRLNRTIRACGLPRMGLANEAAGRAQSRPIREAGQFDSLILQSTAGRIRARIRRRSPLGVRIGAQTSEKLLERKPQQRGRGRIGDRDARRFEQLSRLDGLNQRLESDCPPDRPLACSKKRLQRALRPSLCPPPFGFKNVFQRLGAEAMGD